MLSTDLDLDLTTLDSLDYVYVPPCEGETHNRSLHGHVASEPASWMLVMPCCGPKLLVCESRRRYIRAGFDIKCNSCGTWRDVADIDFLPIADVKL